MRNSAKYRVMKNTYRPRKSFRSHRTYGRSRRPQKGSSLKKIFFWLILFLLLFWAGKSIFLGGEEVSAEAGVTIRQGVLEFSLSGEDLWTRGMSGQKFLEGDKLRCTGNCEASVDLLNGGSIIVLGPNTELEFTELSQDSTGRKNIKLSVTSGEIWGTIADDEFSKKKSYFLLTTPSSEIDIKGAILDVTTGITDLIRVLRGTVELRAIDPSGKKSDVINMSIGQQLLMDTAAKELFFSDSGQKAMEALDTSFEESEWNLQNLELFSPQEAAAIRHRIELSASPATTQDPEKNGLDSPTITSPAPGAIIPAAQDMLELEGVAPIDAYRISVNGYILTKFQPGDRKWSYFASKKFGTLVPGENTFKVIALSRDGRESAPASITITYNATQEPVVVAEATSDFPVPVIQTPVLTDNTKPFETQDSVLKITGIVDPRTVAVEVNGFRLQKYKPGDTQWAYTANAQYGNMVVGENTYTVVAFGPNNEKSSVSIRVDYTPQ